MRFWLVFLMLVCALTSARAEETYQTYYNARFGYSIVYPSSLLVPQREADNGDGRKFLSRDGRVKLTVYGVNNALNRTHAQEYARAQDAWNTDGAKITLSKLTPQHFALSGFIDNNIFYEKTVFRGDTFCTMIWEYPKELRQRVDTPLNRSFASFTGTTTPPKKPVSKSRPARPLTRRVAPAPTPRPKFPVRTAVKAIPPPKTPTRATPALRPAAKPTPKPRKLTVQPRPTPRPKPTPKPTLRPTPKPTPTPRPTPKPTRKPSVSFKGGY